MSSYIHEFFFLVYHFYEWGIFLYSFLKRGPWKGWILGRIRSCLLNPPRPSNLLNYSSFVVHWRLFSPLLNAAMLERKKKKGIRWFLWWRWNRMVWLEVRWAWASVLHLVRHLGRPTTASTLIIILYGARDFINTTVLPDRF